MNDPHPSGTATPLAPASDDAEAPYGRQQVAYGDHAPYGDYTASGLLGGAHPPADFAADPLFGDFSAHPAPAVGAYDAALWPTGGGHHTAHYDAYPAEHAYTPAHGAPAHSAAAQDVAGYDTGAWDTTGWAAGYQYLATVPQQSAPAEASGQWDTTAWLPADGAGFAADHTAQWDWNAQPHDTGVYDATQWNSDGAPADHTVSVAVGEDFAAPAAHPEHLEPHEHPVPSEPSAADGDGDGDGDMLATGELPAAPALLEEQEEQVPAPAPTAGSRGAGRSRRRSPAKRSALLTVAVPSACVMGVAGIAAASVGGLTGETTQSAAAASDVHPVQSAAANHTLDTQLQRLSAGADDFADRASRTQERIDLRAQQQAEKKKAAQNAARKERLRPKFVLPVTQRGLSAYFGQAGVNWMSVHTGIDFPVSFGTQVVAATDGTVRTQWNSAYGNMLILTAKDGTQTWYCHLSRYQASTGTVVKAGEPIAYSGNSGNSTGPHLHFEVRPAGGPPVDPLPWLRSHGLDPT
ncbi:M23 family metallopeptidase [Streptomyces sp. NPDC046985]|uniref:M23 family metallopeptidase n=1 Tax=Streptomyces sp. NPDC046985 TaxID=3155377 RepID=UPI0033F698A3